MGEFETQNVVCHLVILSQAGKKGERGESWHLFQEAGSVLKGVYVLASESGWQLAQTCHMKIDFAEKGTTGVLKNEMKGG